MNKKSNAYIIYIKYTCLCSILFDQQNHSANCLLHAVKGRNVEYELIYRNHYHHSMNVIQRKNMKEEMEESKNTLKNPLKWSCNCRGVAVTRVFCEKMRPIHVCHFVIFHYNIYRRLREYISLSYWNSFFLFHVFRLWIRIWFKDII